MCLPFFQHYLLKRLSFPHWAFLAPLSNISWLHMWEFNSELSILFYWSMCLFITCHTVFITITLYSIIFWNKKVWYLQFCSASSGLLWLLGVFCGFIWILGFFFNFCEQCHWYFVGDCVESIDGFGQYAHFNNIKSYDSWTQDVFPFYFFNAFPLFMPLFRLAQYFKIFYLLCWLIRYSSLFCYISACFSVYSVHLQPIKSIFKWYYILSHKV